jgi:hypothetical protein
MRNVHQCSKLGALIKKQSSCSGPFSCQCFFLPTLIAWPQQRQLSQLFDESSEWVGARSHLVGTTWTMAPNSVTKRKGNAVKGTSTRRGAPGLQTQRYQSAIFGSHPEQVAPKSQSWME